MKEKDLIIFDPYRLNNDLLEFLDLKKSKKIKILRGNPYYSFRFNLKIISHFLSNIFKFWARELRRSSFLYFIVLMYYSAVIKWLNPKVVFTVYSSTSSIYYDLARLHPNIVFKAYVPYQLHDRHLKSIKEPESNCYISVYDQSDIKRLFELGFAKDNLQYLGSLRLSLLNDKKIASESNELSISIISQFNPSWYSSPTNIESQGDKIFRDLCSLTIKYSILNGLKINILGRPFSEETHYILEKKWFDTVFDGVPYTYHSQDVQKLSSYQYALKSELIVSHYSTLAFEMLDIGKRVVFVQTHDYSEKYVIPEMYSPITLRYFDFNKFVDCINASKEFSTKNEIVERINYLRFVHGF